MWFELDEESGGGGVKCKQASKQANKSVIESIEYARFIGSCE